MASQSQALARHPDPPAEDDYRILCATLEASERGRAFLSEYARRNRQADTETLLAAIDRLAAQIRADTGVLQHMRGTLATLLGTIRRVRANGGGHADELVDTLERQIATLIGPPADAQAGADAAGVTASAHTDAPSRAKPIVTKIVPPSAERLKALTPIMALSEDERLALFT